MELTQKTPRSMNFLSRNNISVLKNQNGSLLILTIFFLVILSLLAFSVGYTVRQKLQIVTRLENREKLRLACEVAVHQVSVYIKERMTFSRSHGLNQAWAQSENLWKQVKMDKATYSIGLIEEAVKKPRVYGLIDEERKINPNSAAPKVLQALFEETGGVEREEARRIVAAIRDWKDEDSDLTDGGSESKDYLNYKPPYRAKNAPLSILQELLWIKGITPEIYTKLLPYFTLDAKFVNINTAEEPVLKAMGVQPTLITKLLVFRAGKDGRAGTADDGVFANLMEVPDVLGRFLFLQEADRQELADLLTFGFSVNSNTFTAHVTAQLNSQNQKIRVTAVVNQDGGIKRWYEEFY